MTRFRRLGIARLVAGLGVFAMVAWVAASNQVSACESRPFAEAKVPGDPRLWLELALTAEQQTRGLMFRQTMPNDLGMLFAFGERTGGAFWMRNTLIPLSIAYIDNDGTILDIQDMQPQSDEPHFPAKPYWYALEVNQGWFAANGVTAGNVLALCLPLS